MRKIVFYSFILGFGLFSCEQNSKERTLNDIATDYVKLGLEIGAYDPVFVDAYYGPDSLKYNGEVAAKFPAEKFQQTIASLKAELAVYVEDPNSTDDQIMRSRWITAQLTAFARRVDVVKGEYGTFDEEAVDLFGVEVPKYDSTHFIALIEKLEALLPGEGSIAERFTTLSKNYIIPEEKMDTLFHVAIEAARKATQAKFDLPEQESFTLEYVQNKTWSGYNWYQGNYKSLIQINIDNPIYVDRVIDLACHEGYPGHHVYNMMLEKNLYADKGWVEISLYPLFSPQSLIAEGSANYGIEMVYPGKKFDEFAQNVLLPLAGIDTTGSSAYFSALRIKEQLNYARNEAARGILNNTMSESEYNHWLANYAMTSSSVPFIKKYRSYVVNYNYGKDLVKAYIESQSATPEERWMPFEKLLSNPVIPKEMLPAME